MCFTPTKTLAMQNGAASGLCSSRIGPPICSLAARTSVICSRSGGSGSCNPGAFPATAARRTCSISCCALPTGLSHSKGAVPRSFTLARSAGDGWRGASDYGRDHEEGADRIHLHAGPRCWYLLCPAEAVHWGNDRHRLLKIAGPAIDCLASLRATAHRVVRQIVVVAHEECGPNPSLHAVIQAAGAVTMTFRGAFDFAAMNNLGAGVAEAPNLLFFNDDVRATEPEWAEQLAEQLSREEVGVAGAVLRYPSGVLQHAGI